VIIHGILEKPVVLADMPLVAGMAAAGNGVRVQIAGLTTVTVQRPNPLKFTEGAFVIAEATDLGLVNSYWVDRDRGLAWPLGNPWLSPAIPFSSQIGVAFFNRPNPRFRRGENWIDEPDDLARSRLVALGRRSMIRFECQVDLPRLTYGPSGTN
jgi:hypothetical protein